MSSQFLRTLEVLKKNKKLREEGKHITIPTPFERFNEYFPGIQQGKYYLVSGNQKSGKTQITDYLFMYGAIDFILSNQTNIKLKIFRFELEMDKHSKYKQAICYRLFKKYGLILSPAKLESLFKNYVLSDDIVKFIEEDKEWFDKFEEIVEIHDDINTRNPFGIYKVLRAWFENNGTYIYKKVKITSDSGKEEEIDTIDYYKPNDPNLFTIIIVDNINLLSSEKGSSLYDTIGKFSSDYMVRVRNRWGGIPVIIQQQALSKESNDSIKLDRTKPSADGLSDNKATSKDCNLMLTIYSPFRNKIRNYNDYDITKLKDTHRELSIELNRDGIMCSTDLYFNGAINYFEELKNSNEIDYKYYEKEFRN